MTARGHRIQEVGLNRCDYNFAAALWWQNFDDTRLSDGLVACVQLFRAFRAINTFAPSLMCSFVDTMQEAGQIWAGGTVVAMPVLWSYFDRDGARVFWLQE